MRFRKRDPRADWLITQITNNGETFLDDYVRLEELVNNMGSSLSMVSNVTINLVWLAREYFFSAEPSLDIYRDTYTPEMGRFIRDLIMVSGVTKNLTTVYADTSDLMTMFREMLTNDCPEDGLGEAPLPPVVKEEFVEMEETARTELFRESMLYEKLNPESYSPEYERLTFHDIEELLSADRVDYKYLAKVIIAPLKDMEETSKEFMIRVNRLIQNLIIPILHTVPDLDTAQGRFNAMLIFLKKAGYISLGVTEWLDHFTETGVLERAPAGVRYGKRGIII